MNVLSGDGVGAVTTRLSLILDIILNFFTSYNDSHGRVITEHSQIARRYARTWLVVDVLAAIPYDALDLLGSGTRKVHYSVILNESCTYAMIAASLFPDAKMHTTDQIGSNIGIAGTVFPVHFYHIDDQHGHLCARRPLVRLHMVLHREVRKESHH